VLNEQFQHESFFRGEGRNSRRPSHGYNLTCCKTGVNSGTDGSPVARTTSNKSQEKLEKRETSFLPFLSFYYFDPTVTDDEWFRNLSAHGMKYFQLGPSVWPPSC
jgi:hypothetical protein